MNKKIIIWSLVIIALILLGSFIFSKPSINANSILANYDGKLELHKSFTCGCCDVYSKYFLSRGNSKTNLILSQDINALKNKVGVPSAMESCHTLIIGEYFVEGHVPVEAIEKLLIEKPDIKGIAIPGMPSGSPGMTGTKKGDFVIYAINKDSSYKEFMRI